MIRILLILLTFTSFAQLQTDWDATELLGNMSSSISVGNGCFEGNYKVVTVNGDLDINNSVLELMDVTLQVINGNITQYGNIIDYNNHPNILFNCTSANIICYQETLSEEIEEYNKLNLIIYPNPTINILNIKSNTFVNYEIYDINGKIVKKGNELIINVTNLKKAMYFLITLHVDGYKQVTKFIKI
jgi:hypothetical protein